MSLTSTSNSGSSRRSDPLSSTVAPSVPPSATSVCVVSVVSAGAAAVSAGAVDSSGAAAGSSRVIRLASEGAAVSAGAGEPDMLCVVMWRCSCEVGENNGVRGIIYRCNDDFRHRRSCEQTAA